MNTRKIVILLIFCLIGILIVSVLFFNYIQKKQSYDLEIVKLWKEIHEKFGHSFLDVGVVLQNYENIELNVSLQIIFTWRNQSGDTITTGIIPGQSEETLNGHFEIPYLNLLTSEIEASAEILNITATS